MTGLLKGFMWECASIQSVSRPRKKWIETMKGCLKKISLDVRQARRTAHGRSVWRGFVSGND